MARIVLTVGGYVLGNVLLPGLGGALGGYVGGMVDQQLFGGTARQTVCGARMQDLRVQSSSYESVIPTLYGKGRLAANVIWMRGFDEEIRTETQTVDGGGKDGRGGSTDHNERELPLLCRSRRQALPGTDRGGAPGLRRQEFPGERQGRQDAGLCQR